MRDESGTTNEGACYASPLRDALNESLGVLKLENISLASVNEMFFFSL